jgi:hypothetical protein
MLLLFVGSGCAALIYEIVWFQLLQLTIGSSAVSLGVLLGTFMGGMCLGSFLLPRYVDRKHHPLRIYAMLELGIGAMGLLLLFAMPVVNTVYTAVGGSGFAGVILRGIVASICLLPPTLMMGATLPAMARWVETTPRGVSWLGFFYGGNIAGAVIGSLLAGLLLRVCDMNITTYVAACSTSRRAIGSPLAKLTTSSRRRRCRRRRSARRRARSSHSRLRSGHDGAFVRSDLDAPVVAGFWRPLHSRSFSRSSSWTRHRQQRRVGDRA